MRLLSTELKYLESNSSRKRVVTIVYAGCTVSPSIVSIYVRSGWFIGRVKNWCLKHEIAGDQHVGRCMSELNQLSKDFTMSPSYVRFGVKWVLI